MSTKMIKYPWGTDRRYNSLADHFIKKFGCRVQKVSVNVGFTCPNRDGTKGVGGCTYCDSDSFSPSYCKPDKPVDEQLRSGIEFHKKRYKNAGYFIAYFQSYTNTYSDVDQLRKIYQSALAVPGIIGLVIGTRPDCADNKTLDMIAEINKDHYVAIEFGVESCYDRTLKEINRGHNFQTTVDAIGRTTERGIKTGAHLIFGLPGESIRDMINEAEIVSKLPITSLKLHQLQIIKNTKIANEFKQNPSRFKLFEIEEYINFVTEFIEKVNPEIIIERISGEVPLRFIDGGIRWGVRNDIVIKMFENNLEQKNTWQGRFFAK